MIKKQKGEPKYKSAPAGKEIRLGANPDSYLKENPVWRFKDFDWDGPWGQETCIYCIRDMKKYIEKHLASLETMTWEEILKASGGRKYGSGGNSHHMSVEKLTKDAKDRLKVRGINADTVFSLRLEQCVRIYGVREGNCLSIVFLDPHHCQRDGRAAYKW